MSITLSYKLEMYQLTYQKKLIGKQVLSTNSVNNLSQVHEVEACQSEHQEFFWPVDHSIGAT